MIKTKTKTNDAGLVDGIRI